MRQKVNSLLLELKLIWDEKECQATSFFSISARRANQETNITSQTRICAVLSVANPTDNPTCSVVSYNPSPAIFF